MGRPAVLMISGSGRSGTTILSVLLTQGTDTLNIGQSRDFWKAYAENRLCTCGQTLQACPLWSTIALTAFPTWSDDDYLGVHQAMRNFVKEARSLSSFANNSVRNRLAERHADFILHTRKFLEACIRCQPVRALVDTSKSPEIALAVHLTDLAEVHVLNLVRDPRAVLVSWAKKEGVACNFKQHMAEWKNRQSLLNRWQPEPHLKHRVLDYSAFVARPLQEIEATQTWLGAKTAPSPFVNSHEALISWNDQHLFPPANEKVLAEKRLRVEVQSNDEWKDPEHAAHRRTAMLKTFPLGPAYALKSALRVWN